jgi:hypothetical protein
MVVPSRQTLSTSLKIYGILYKEIFEMSAKCRVGSRDHEGEKLGAKNFGQKAFLLSNQ